MSHRSVGKRYRLFLGAIAAFVAACPVRADEKADALLKEVQAANKAAQTLTADIEMKQVFMDNEFKATASVKLKKPNLARIEIAGQFAQTVASDGKTQYNVFGSGEQQQYQKRDAHPQGLTISALWATQVSDFFIGRSSLPPTATTTTSSETVGGVKYDVIAAKAEPQTYRFYVGADRLVHGIAREIKRENDVVKIEAWMRNVKVGIELAAADFKYEPPATAKLYEPPDYNKLLLPVGEKAPDFNLPQLSGANLALSEAVKGKKATIINFWFYS